MTLSESINETRLDNGIVVLTDEMTDVRSVTLGFFFRVGSRNEPDEINGMMHFIEHCVFKGSSKRSAIQIAKEQDRLGGGLDAFTTHEETGFIIKVVDDKFADAFDLLSDMLVEPRFEEADLVNERRVIIEEIKMNEDSPEDVLGEIFHREFFPNNPLGLSIAGTPQSVKSFNRQLVREFHRRAFSPQNLIVTAAGNVDHETLVNAVRSLNLSPTLDSPIWEATFPKSTGQIVIEHRTDLEQAHLLFAAPLVSANSPDRYAADLLANILGGGASSRLWQKIREDRGLAYSVGASTGMFHDCGYLTVSAATSPDQAREVVSIVRDELRAVAREGVTEDELELMKEQARATILLSLEDSASRAASLAECELIHRRQISVFETIRNIEAVSAADIHELAKKHLRSETVAFFAIGDIKRDDLFD